MTQVSKDGCKSVRTVLLVVDILSQILSWSTETWPQPNDIQDIVTEVLTLYLINQMALNEPSFMFLAPLSTGLTYLGVLFINKVISTAYIAGQCKNK